MTRNLRIKRLVACPRHNGDISVHECDECSYCINRDDNTVDCDYTHEDERQGDFGLSGTRSGWSRLKLW